MRSMEEIRELFGVSREVKTGNSFRDKLFNSFSTIGLILGLILFMLSFGIIFGFITSIFYGFLKMIRCIKYVLNGDGNEKSSIQDSLGNTSDDQG